MDEATVHKSGPDLLLPGPIAERLRGYRSSRSLIGQSEADVFRLEGDGALPDLFLKRAHGLAADDLADEMAKLRWLAGYLPVPDVICFVRDADTAWLLTSALHGSSAETAILAQPDRRLGMIDAITDFLVRLHAIPAEECPFNSQFSLRLSKARRRIDAGLVDIADFDAPRAGWSAEQVWDRIQSMLPMQADAVVTHGDFSLDNILIHDGKVVGCIDVGKLGLADRYQDIAILWNGLGDFGDELRDRMLHTYGLGTPDLAKLELHLLLDELF